jgi:hypothetical protein
MRTESKAILTGLSSAQQDKFVKNLKRMGLDLSIVNPNMKVVKTSSAPLVFSNPPDPNCPIKPTILQTHDLDEFKQWIGIADSDASPANTAALAPFTRGTDFDIEDLSEEESASLLKAGETYVFGHSSLAEGYKPAIEKAYAPYSLAVYAAPNVQICANNPLIISGSLPVSLTFGNIDIYTGGYIQITTTCQLTCSSLVKHNEPCPS